MGREEGKKTEKYVRTHQEKTHKLKHRDRDGITYQSFRKSTQ